MTIIFKMSVSFQRLNHLHEECNFLYTFLRENRDNLNKQTQVLENRVDRGFTDAHLYYALYQAAEAGDVKTVNRLIQSGAPITESAITTRSGIHILDHPDFTLIEGAIAGGSPDILSTLISHGVSIDQTCKSVGFFSWSTAILKKLRYLK